MIIVRLINLLFGYIRFSASGGFPERFINLCARMSVKVWDIRPHKGTLSGKCRASEYRKLRHIAKKTGMTLRISRKTGVPFLIRSYRKRLGFFIGIPIFIVFITVMSGRIWSVSIMGNSTLSDDIIRQSLSDIGIREGVRSDSFNASDAERQLLLNLDSLSWIALNVDGAVLHVEVRETIENLAPNDYLHPCHIVASKDGFLKTLETFEGTKSADINTAVSKGQLLISGIIEAKDKSISLCHAKGIAKAETHEEMHFEIKKSQTFHSVCDSDFRIRLKLFNIPFSIGILPHAENNTVYSEEIHMHANGKRLPVSYEKIRQITFDSGKKVLNQDEAMLFMMSKIHEALIEKSLVCDILESDISFSESNSSLHADVKLKLLENIGQEADILTEETENQSLFSPSN